jgi:hypothetical protein
MTDKQDAELIRMIRQEKAERAIRAVGDGANPAAEAFVLANEFTDSITHSVAARLQRWLRLDR